MPLLYCTRSSAAFCRSGRLRILYSMRHRFAAGSPDVFARNAAARSVATCGAAPFVRPSVRPRSGPAVAQSRPRSGPAVAQSRPRPARLPSACRCLRITLQIRGFSTLLKQNDGQIRRFSMLLKGRIHKSGVFPQNGLIIESNSLKSVGFADWDLWKRGKASDLLREGVRRRGKASDLLRPCAGAGAQGRAVSSAR